MASIAVTVCNAIVEALNGHSFSQPVTAIRTNVPKYELRKDDGLKIQVVPSAQGTAHATRGDLDWQPMIDIGIQKYVDNDDTDVDVLLELVDEIILFLMAVGRKFANHVVMSTRNEPIYDVESLDRLRMFFSVVTLELRALVGVEQV